MSSISGFATGLLTFLLSLKRLANVLIMLVLTTGIRFVGSILGFGVGEVFRGRVAERSSTSATRFSVRCSPDEDALLG